MGTRGTFVYGDAETVIDKLDGVEKDLATRRVFILTLEAKNAAEIAFYERTAPGRVTISRWKGAPNGDFHTAVNEAIIANRGVHCVGEQTKAIVKRLPRLETESDISAPHTAKAAISHQIRAHDKEYLRASLYLLC